MYVNSLKHNRMVGMHISFTNIAVVMPALSTSINKMIGIIDVSASNFVVGKHV